MPHDPTNAPRTALVLSSGASHGAVQVGVVRALLEAGVSWDFVMGSSVGGLNGAFLCSYSDPADGLAALDKAWRTIKRRNAFPFAPIQGLRAFLGLSNHLFPQRGLRDWIAGFLRYERLEDFPRPVQLAAVDLLTGEEMVYDKGPALTLLLATSAIPGAFPPVEYEGRTLVDGGIGQYTPLAAAIRAGAKRLIVVSTGYSCALSQPPRTSMSMLLQSFDLLIADQLASEWDQYRDEVEMVVVPPLCPLEIPADDFTKGPELIERAYANTKAWIAGGGLTRHDFPHALRRHVHGENGECGD